MTLKAWCQTDVGLKRDSNQDSYLIDEELGLFIVADGMGGHKGGEVASRLAVEKIHGVVRRAISESGQRKISPRLVLTQGYEEASREIFTASQEPGAGLEGMGTTVVACFFYENVLYIGNVGDSRAYLFGHEHLWQLTEDHSLLNEQLRAGIINEADVPKFSSKNVITRSVGFEREVVVDIIERPVGSNELYLICSDGLTSLVPDQRIAELCKTQAAESLVPHCIAEAKKNGGDDNVTVMVLLAES